MSLGQPVRDEFKLKSVLIPETEQQERLNQLVTPRFERERTQAFGEEFSPENIEQISKRFQESQAPRFRREQARLANLLSATGSLQGTPLAISRAQLGGQQQAEVSRFEAGLFERGAGERAADRRAAESREFQIGTTQIANEFTLGIQEDSQEFQQDILNLQRTFNVEDRDLNIQLKKLQTQFQLVKAGQLKGTAAEAVLREAGIQSPEDFFSDDQIALEREAIVQGLTVPELLETRRDLGLLLLADMQENPERYAGLALDPEEEFERQRQLAQAQAPQQGKVLCTELNRQGLLPDHIYKADSDYAATIPWKIRWGYQFWAIPLVSLMKNSKIFTYALKPFITAWAYHMAFKMGITSKRNIFGEILEFIGIPICGFIGHLLMPSMKRRLLGWL